MPKMTIEKFVENWYYVKSYASKEDMLKELKTLIQAEKMEMIDEIEKMLFRMNYDWQQFKATIKGEA